MRWGVLGPLLVRDDAGTEVRVPAGRLQTLLAVLLMRVNRLVTLDEIVDLLWDGKPPGAAPRTVRVYVTRLRQAIGPQAAARVLTRSRGYLCQAGDDEFDLLRFEELCRQATMAGRQGSWAHAAALLNDALGLWRGAPLVDVPSEMLRAREAPRLAQLRLQAVEDHIDAQMNLRQYAALIPQLRELTRDEPLREHLHAQLVRALAGTGRRAEALEAYRRAHRTLVDQLGVDPGPELRDLHQRILSGDEEPLNPPVTGSTHAAATPRPTSTKVEHSPADPTSPARSDPLLPQLPPSLWSSVAESGAGVPPNPTRYFAGREAELRELAGMLERSGRAAVYGLGGVGKTQLVARYVHQNRGRYPDGVFWLRAEQESSLVGDLAGLAWRLGLPERAAPEHERRIEATVRWLGERPRWLVVLDNLEPGAIGTRDRWLPPSLPGHVLTTSRTPLPPPYLRLESFPAATARRYLLERTAQADESAAGAIAEALGRLPLALAQAAAYLDETGRDLPSYAALLRGRLVELMAEGRPDDYPRSVVSTLSLSVQRLADEHPAAVALLRLCAFLAGEEIPLEALRAGASGLPQPLRDALRDELAIDRTVAALRRYSLAEREGDGLRVHRVVQAIVRGSLPTEEYRASLGAAVRLLAPHFPDYIDERPQLWPMCVRLLPHAQVLDDLTADDQVEPAALAALLHGAGSYLWSQGEYRLAEPPMERAAAIAEQSLGAGHRLTIVCAQGLGILRWYQGDLSQARQLLQRQAAVLEQYPQDSQTLLATVLHNLAGVLHAQGELAAARPLYERALELRRRVLGPEHQHTAYTLNNLGTLLRDQGDLAAALPMLEHALSIRVRVLGTEHPETAQSLASLGLLRFRQGDLDPAGSALTQALAIRQKVLGPSHDRTARTRYHLGLVRWEQGDLVAARRLIRRAATDLRPRLGAEHPWTVEARTALTHITEAGGADTQ